MVLALGRKLHYFTRGGDNKQTFPLYPITVPQLPYYHYK